MPKKVLKASDLAKKMGLKDKVQSGPSTSKVELTSDAKSGVINKKTLDARDKAQEIIDEARKESEKIRKESESILAQVKAELERAKKEGFEQGKEEGLSSVTEHLVKFEAMKEDFYKDVEENTIKLVMMVAEKVIGKIVQENSAAIKSIVAQALESSIGDKIIVKLNPDDFKVVKESEAEFQAMLDRTKRITFKEDEGIEQGGCMVETEVGTIDARLETQLKAIRKALKL